MSRKKSLSPVKTPPQEGFALSKGNYKFMVIGVVIVIIGFLLMVGGGSDDPNVFNEAVFSTQRITIAPLVVLLGYGVIFYAILHKEKPKLDDTPTRD